MRKLLFCFILALVFVSLPFLQARKIDLTEQVAQSVHARATVVEGSMPDQLSSTDPETTSSIVAPAVTLQSIIIPSHPSDSDSDVPIPLKSNPEEPPVFMSGTIQSAMAALLIQPPPVVPVSPANPVSPVPAPNRTVVSGQAMVALTFDDGPNGSVTTSILNTLQSHQATATFFVLGCLIPGNQALLARMVAEGHEIGNHTYSHPNLTKVSQAECLNQINLTQNAVLSAVGVTPRLMRPPYGTMNQSVLGYLPLPAVNWSVDPRDWNRNNSQDIVNAVLSTVKDGDIVVMHDRRMVTANAIAVIVPELKNRGYQLVTVSELFEARGIKLRAGSQVYRKAY